MKTCAKAFLPRVALWFGAAAVAILAPVGRRPSKTGRIVILNARIDGKPAKLAFDTETQAECVFFVLPPNASASRSSLAPKRLKWETSQPCPSFTG